MGPVRSLVLTSLLAMKTLVTLAISNNFDERYPWLKRAQEEPEQLLAFEVPCKYCILTVKLGYSIRPHLVSLNNLKDSEKHILLRRVIIRIYFTNKSKMPSRPGRFHIIKSSHEQNNFFCKKSQFFRLMYCKNRKCNKKRKLSWQKLLRHLIRARITRTRYLAHSRKNTRSTGFNVLPKRAHMMMKHPIATVSKLVEIKKDSSPETKTSTLRVKQRIKITTKPLKLRTKNETKIEVVKHNAGVSQSHTTKKSQEETTLKNLLPVTITGLLSKTHNRTIDPLKQYKTIMQFLCGTSTEVHPTDTIKCELTIKTPRNLVEEATTEIKPIIPILKSFAQSNASSIIEPEEKRITPLVPFVTKGYMEEGPLDQQVFAQALDHFDRFFYNATFKMLSPINPPDRRENGISFVQSGLLLNSFLSALYLEVNSDIQQELKTVLDIATPAEIQTRLNIMRHILDSLPPSEEDLKLRWSTRLMVNGSWTPSTSALDTLHISVEHIDATATPEQLTVILNNKVEEDSAGAMRNTFEEDELAEGVSAVLLSTLYLRARWRSAPTLLNGTRAFRDAPGSTPRTTRMIRINDIMHYASLPQWDAEAVEISYSTPGLSLLLLVPGGRSLRNLSVLATEHGLNTVYATMRTIRVAVTMPMYTLRMTLLLPNKLQAMGLSRLVGAKADNESGLRLSHAVQRIMFWAEAGRNAFKDDGFEWDDVPQLEMLVDRPYLFYVRWRNLTLMNGNFVL